MEPGILPLFASTLLTCASLLGSAALSRADGIVAEDFTYANGGLNGQNGGTGFSTAWSSSTHVTGGVSVGTDPSTRSLATPFSASGTLWVSFDWGYSAQPTENGSYGGLTFYIGGSEKFLIGNTWPGSGHDVWRMNGSGSTGVTNHGGMKTGVAKITLGAGPTSSVELWVGPAGSPVNVSGPAMATASGRELAGVDGIRIAGNDFGSNNPQSFDNLLIGTTVADVDATDVSTTPDGYEAGLTFRLYDIREAMDQLYPLVPGQTPNVDQKRGTIDWSTSADFAGYSAQFLVECFASLDIPTAGSYEFRLTSDDGSELWIDETLVIDHDGLHAATAMDGSIALSAGLHPMKLRFFQSGGGFALKLEWRPPGATNFATVPASAFLTPSGVTRVVAPGKKEIITPGDSSRPGNGQPLDAVHPSWRVTTIHPASFQPKVGAMAVHPTDGRLFISTFNPNQAGFYDPETLPGGDGKIWALTQTQGEDPEAVTVTEVAAGLSEPLGLEFIDGDLHVTQRNAITRLRDTNGDGYYETATDIGGGWVTDNYHHFHFGLLERDGFAYTTLSTAIHFQYPGLSGPNPPNRGTLVRTDLATGEVTYLAGGLRTPNGIGFGPEGEIFQTDNQGAWMPSSRLNHLQPGKFYGHYNTTAGGGSPSLFADQPASPPAVWFPHNEIANSPSQPLSIPDGPFAGDLLVGDITLGGINRVSLEKIRGVWQGCIYRFTHGLEGGVNRLAWGPNGTLYVGCIGGGGNWAWNDTTTGLQRLTPLSGNPVTFEIARVTATATGFEIAYTRPVPEEVLENPANFTVRQWSYQATADYGGPKIGEETLAVSSATASADRTRVTLVIPGLEEGHVVYLKSDPLAEDGSQILSSEVWYTLNEIPNGPLHLQLNGSSVPENQPSGTPVGTLSAAHDNSGETITFSLPVGALDNALFSINGAVLATAEPFDYERRSSYQIRVRATDEAGLHSEATFGITIGNVAVENAPRRILLTNAGLPPDHQPGALVGRLLIDDADLGDLSVIPYQVAFPSFELVAGAGDTNNASFIIVGDRLTAASILPAGLYRLRIQATDSNELSYSQPLLVWVGAGHLDSNNDGIDDATASRLGFDPLGPMDPGAYFGRSGTSPIFGPGSGPQDFLLTSDTLPGNLYWVENSPDLAEWTLDPQSIVAPMSFLETWNKWSLVRPADPRHFWRIGGGWPDSHGINPLANGLAGLTFVGGSAGWTYDANSGILRHDSAAPSDWLHFAGAYGDFLLRLDYRLSEGGNSGVFVRSAATGYPWVTGSEVQLTHEPRLPIHSTGAIYDRIPAEPAADASHSVWHRLEILMIAGRIRVKVDGVTTVDEPDVRLSHPQVAWSERGVIGLQNSHAAAPGHVEFRDIRILRLSP